MDGRNNSGTVDIWIYNIYINETMQGWMNGTVEGGMKQYMDGWI